MADQDKITRVVELMGLSRSIIFITGAGISADSGLPTYRGVGGLYKNNTTEDGMSSEMALSGDILRSNPEITNDYIQTFYYQAFRDIFDEFLTKTSWEKILIKQQKVPKSSNIKGFGSLQMTEMENTPNSCIKS